MADPPAGRRPALPEPREPQARRRRRTRRDRPARPGPRGPPGRRGRRGRPARRARRAPPGPRVQPARLETRPAEPAPQPRQPAHRDGLSARKQAGRKSVNGGILEKGTKLGGYRITGILGQGGVGGDYEAVHMTLSRTGAITVLAPALSGALT